MPSFNITGPDGKKYRVTGENAEGALNALRKSQGGSSTQNSGDNSVNLPTSSGEAYRRSFIEGMPVVGPYIGQGVDALAASIVAGLDPNRSYEDVRASQQQRSQELQREHPTASTLGSLSGTVAGTVPMVAAAPGLFGAAGSAGRRLIMGTASGGILGGLDAGVRSGFDPTEMKQGGMLGAALGILAPGAGHVLGEGARLATRTLGPRATPAQRLFSEALNADNIESAAEAARIIGPEAMPVDLGPNLKGLGQGVVTVPGSGRAVIDKAVRTRDAGANKRIGGMLDDTLGKASTPAQTLASIEDGMGRLGPIYDDALRGAKPVYTATIAKQFDEMAANLRGNPQRAAQSVRNMLNETGKDSLDKSARTLLNARRAIDGMMETADGPTKSVLTMMRHQIDGELTRAVPGIKSVDAQYHELARQREAFSRGQQVLESGRTAPRPAELAEEFNAGGVPEGRMVGPSGVPKRLKEGARAEIDRIIGTNANDRVALQKLIKGEGDWSRDRLTTLFGKEKADKVFALLDREKLYSETSADLLRNSETAKRQENVAKVKDQGRAGLLEEGGNLQFGTAAKRMGEKLFSGMNAPAKDASLKELAQLLTGPSGFSAKIDAIQAAKRRGDLTKEAANRLIHSLMIGSGGKAATAR